MVICLRSSSTSVTCTTRRGKTLDRCYGSVKDAYTAYALPHLGRSDHNAVHLLPKYRQRLKRVNPRCVTVRKWSGDALDALQGCFHCTDWDSLSDPPESIDTNVGVTADYIKFCLDSFIPHTQKQIYPNSKPSFSSHIYTLLKEKRTAFRENNTSKLAEVARKVRSAVRRAKLKYRRRRWRTSSAR